MPTLGGETAPPWWRRDAEQAGGCVPNWLGVASKTSPSSSARDLARAGVAAGERGAVQVKHAPGEGDEMLVELCAPGVVLVTADRELRDRARERGADVQGPGWLLDQLDY
jgi:hypothetical protein